MDVAYIYSWRKQTSPMRFLFCIYDKDEPLLTQPIEKQSAVTINQTSFSPTPEPIENLKTEPNCGISRVSLELETETSESEPTMAVSVEVQQEIKPAYSKQEVQTVMVKHSVDDHPVISIPSPPPSSESTPELDLLDLMDKNLKEELLINNNNNKIDCIKEEVGAPPLHLNTTVKSNTRETVSSSSPAIGTAHPTSPSIATTPLMSSPKSYGRSLGDGAVAITIASELASKQHKNVQSDCERRTGNQVESICKASAAMPSARLGNSSLEIKLVPSSVAKKSSFPAKSEPSKPQTSITLKCPSDREKSKFPVAVQQPSLSVESILSKQSISNAFPSVLVQPVEHKAQCKRPKQPYKFPYSEERKTLSDEGSKRPRVDGTKAKLKSQKDQGSLPIKTSHKLYQSSTISPFMPVHKSSLHYPSSPASLSEPKIQPYPQLSPSRSSSDLQHYSPLRKPNASLSLEPHLSPLVYNGLLAAAVASHPNQTTAAAIYMRQQLEFKKLYPRPQWSFSQNLIHRTAAANTMKRINEDYMRSLLAFGVGSSTTIPTNSTITELSSSGGSNQC